MPLQIRIWLLKKHYAPVSSEQLVHDDHQEVPDQRLVVHDEEVFIDEDHDEWAFAHGCWWRRHLPPSKEVCSDIAVKEVLPDDDVEAASCPD